MYRYKALKIKGKKIDEHRLVMENHLKRKLNFDECVHHINGDTKDNNIQNLKLMSRREHGILEMKNGKLHKIVPVRRKIKEGKVFCSSCKKYLSRDEYHKHKNRMLGIDCYCKECKSKKYHTRRLGKESRGYLWNW